MSPAAEEDPCRDAFSAVLELIGCCISANPTQLSYPHVMIRPCKRNFSKKPIFTDKRNIRYQKPHQILFVF